MHNVRPFGSKHSYQIQKLTQRGLGWLQASWTSSYTLKASFIFIS